MHPAEDKTVTQRSRYINITDHWLRNLDRNDPILIEYCPTRNMFEDTMTKPLGRVKFARFRQLLGIVGLLEPVCALCAG